MSGLPKMSNISKIREQIKQNEEIKAEARKSLDISQIVEIWTAYSENNPSKSTQSALNLAKLDLIDKTIKIIVPAQITKDMILQETDLIFRLREELGFQELMLDIIVDISEFPDFEENKPVQSLNQKERYLAMLEKNPNLGLFTKTFLLKLDSEI